MRKIRKIGEIAWYLEKGPFGKETELSLPRQILVLFINLNIDSIISENFVPIRMV